MQHPEVKHQDSQEIAMEVLADLMKDILERGAQFRFKARGGSMHPFIQDGDLITVAPLLKEKPAVGKVVAFLQPAAGQLKVHRIIRRRGLNYLIQGDNTSGRADGWVRSQDILGCVTRVERDGKTVRLGQGLERYLVVLLSQNTWLRKAVARLKSLKAFHT